MQDLDESSLLADLFSNQMQDLKRAFANDDNDDDILDDDGLRSSEARTWLATLYVTTDVVCVTDDTTSANDVPEDLVTLHQSAVESKTYHLPVVSSSQAAVANEIILRILISKG